jgi:hypothetical protein
MTPIVATASDSASVLEDLLTAGAGYAGLRAGCCADRIVQRLMSQ